MKPAFVHTAPTAAEPCPVCRARLDAATGISLHASERRPTLQIGSISVCAYCHAILIVTTIGFRVATEAEINTLEPPARRVLLAYVSQRKGASS
jgi:hypothetical protein